MDKIELESNAKSRLNYLDSISHTLSRMNKLIVDCWMNFLSFEWKRSCCKLSEWMFSSVLYEINSYVYEIAETLPWVHLVGVFFFPSIICLSLSIYWFYGEASVSHWTRIFRKFFVVENFHFVLRLHKFGTRTTCNHKFFRTFPQKCADFCSANAFVYLLFKFIKCYWNVNFQFPLQWMPFCFMIRSKFIRIEYSACHGLALRIPHKNIINTSK